MFKLFKNAAVETAKPETVLQAEAAGAEADLLEKIAKGEAAILHELDLTSMQRDAILSLVIGGVLNAELDIYRSRTIITVNRDMHREDFWENPFSSLFAQLIFQIPSLSEVIDGVKKDYPGLPAKPSFAKERRYGVFGAGCGD